MSSSNVKYIHFNDGLTLKVENLSSQYFETCYVGLNGDPNNVDDEGKVEVNTKFEHSDQSPEAMMDRLTLATEACSEKEYIIFNYDSRHSLSLWNVAKTTKDKDETERLKQKRDHPLKNPEGTDLASSRGAQMVLEYARGMPTPEVVFTSTMTRTMQSAMGYFGSAGSRPMMIPIDNFREKAYGDAPDLRSDLSILKATFPGADFGTSMPETDDFRERYPTTEGSEETPAAFEARVTEGLREEWTKIKSFIAARDSQASGKRKGSSIVMGRTTHRWTLQDMHQVAFGTEDENFDQAQIKPFVYKVTEIRMDHTAGESDCVGPAI